MNGAWWVFVALQNAMWIGGQILIKVTLIYQSFSFIKSLEIIRHHKSWWFVHVFGLKRTCLSTNMHLERKLFYIGLYQIHWLKL